MLVLNNDLRDNYGVQNPSQVIFNLFIQGAMHYERFTSHIHELMRLEQEFMSSVLVGQSESAY